LAKDIISHNHYTIEKENSKYFSDNKTSIACGFIHRFNISKDRRL
jgi:hypothetical protein